MKIEANTPEEYIRQLPEERQKAIIKLRNTILENLPKGFEETMMYGMIGYVVPKSIYPAGYHVNPDLPLPFISIASQKNHIALYHSGVYTSGELMEWFTGEYPKFSGTRLDMGKSCIRFRNAENIPFSLIASLVSKLSVDDWIKLYENTVKR